MTIPELSVVFSAVVLSVIAIGGFRSNVGSFRRRVAPYCLVAAMGMFIALLLGWLALQILDTSVSS